MTAARGRAAPARLGAALALATALPGLLACHETTPPSACRFGPEHLLAAVSPQVDAVALATAPADAPDPPAQVAWSSRDGTFVRALDGHGAPRAPALRLGPACAGGLATTRTSDATWIACLRRGNPAKDDAGGVVLWRVARGVARVHAAFGSAGREARGVALAAEARDLVLLWQDASGGRMRILRAEVPRATSGAPWGDAVAPRPVSVDALPGTGPALIVHEGRTVAAWAELGVDAAGRTIGRILVDAGRGAAVEAAEVAYDAPAPQLASVGADGLALAYRDTRGRRDKSGLYVVGLGARLQPLAAPRRIARANGPGAPSLAACAGSLFAVAPRTYQRDVLVGITRLTPDLATRGREQQIYEDGRAIAQAALGCTRTGPLLVLGERGTATRPHARLLATALDCRGE